MANLYIRTLVLFLARNKMKVNGTLDASFKSWGLGECNMDYSLRKRLLAELFGTFWLVFGGCGAAVLAAKFPGTGIGFVGVAFAFGLTVLTIAYAFGHISGAHLNPAVTVGLVSANKFPSRELFPYIAAQVIGAVIASAILYFIASGSPDFSVANGFASNGYGTRSPGGYSLGAALLTEIVMTFTFVTVILGVTGKNAPQGFAPLTIGLCLTLIHLVSIPVTNTSVNPARSTGPALFVGGAALGQLWLFWVAPLIGAVVSGSVYRAWHAEQPRLKAMGEEERPIKHAASRFTTRTGT
jgi:aquaporin Z